MRSDGAKLVAAFAMHQKILAGKERAVVESDKKSKGLQEALNGEKERTKTLSEEIHRLKVCLLDTSKETTHLRKITAQEKAWAG